MDPTELPFELQIETLLELTPEDILKYCQSNPGWDKICRSELFWVMKAEHDFGFSINDICRMSPYWKYRFIESIYGEPVSVAPLIRSGKIRVLEDDPEYDWKDKDMIIMRAIHASDLQVLEYYQQYLETMHEDVYFTFLRRALSKGNPRVVDYLISFLGDYPKDEWVNRTIMLMSHPYSLKPDINILNDYLRAWLESGELATNRLSDESLEYLRQL